MIDNPFLSATYQTIWLKHFSTTQQKHSFDSVVGVNFLKSKFLPIYTNIGKNNTNGICYNLNLKEEDYKNRIFVINDVPSYTSAFVEHSESSLKINEIRQYGGCSVKLDGYSSFNDYFNTRFSSGSRSKYRRYIKRLENSFNVDYRVVIGEIELEDYKVLMNEFYLLLTKRFNKLKLHNDIIEKWNFYEDLVYNMLIENRALLNVIYINKKVAAISLTFLSENIAIGAVKAFDVDYNNHNLGNIEIMKVIEWCIDNKYEMFDFSKGEQEYKARFINNKYHFEHHVVYDSGSILITGLASIISRYYALKQYMRKINVNKVLTKYKYRISDVQKESKYKERVLQPNS